MTKHKFILECSAEEYLLILSLACTTEAEIQQNEKAIAAAEMIRMQVLTLSKTDLQTIDNVRVLLRAQLALVLRVYMAEKAVEEMVKKVENEISNFDPK